MKQKQENIDKLQQKLKYLSAADQAFIATFIDGDGCISAQIVKKRDYVLKYQIRVTITFFQKTKRIYILNQIKELLGCGVLRSKESDGVSELTITGVDLVVPILTLLQPFFRLKYQQANLVLKICKTLPAVAKTHDKLGFYELCKIVDQIGALNDAKTRKVTAATVRDSVHFVDVDFGLSSTPRPAIS